ncbi:MAG: GTPase Era [Deltaproteobacteria bacterium]|nr:MAG: GTPase Era [Deltaproteobacteria bacterium]
MKLLSGFVAIIGPTNVGKSTLLNNLLGTKVSIVTPKPQTTRNRIVGIYHGEDSQIIFVDTPGIHRHTKNLLNKSMIDTAMSAIKDVDVILLMVDATNPRAPEVMKIISRLKDANKPSILAINKIDLIKKPELLPMIDRYKDLYTFKAIVPISALKWDGINELINEIKGCLKPGPMFYPEDMKTDQSKEFLISEIIREKIFFFTKQEIPYSCAVDVDFTQKDPQKELIIISARIYVETDSQKKIIIGQSGRMIKKIGQAAREELEFILGKKVYLDLLVRVEKNWTKNISVLRRLGYRV